MVRRAKGSLRHLRRATSPSFWPIHRKEFVWAVKPAPGPHPLARCIPLGVLIRDVLGYALTMKEARKVLAERRVYVDGRVVTDYKFPVGLMDVIYLRGPEEYYRVLPHPTKFFMLHRIGEEEARLKPLRIKRKTMVRGGNLQLTFHDGRNYLLRLRDPMNPVEDTYRTFDTVLLDLSKKEIVEHVRMEEGVLAYVIDGRNVGFLGRVESIHQIFKRARSIVTLKSEDGDVARTILEYVFAIGREKPLISLPTREEVEEWEKRLAREEPV
ncbi:MAG: 30S ribosomal protein S4e [Thermoprotei archaeon]|nr:MAG: 30S ribosomal protein S4e [Thermoprotei archaeon]